MTDEEIDAELTRVASCAGMHLIGRVGLQVAEKLAAEIRRLREENQHRKRIVRKDDSPMKTEMDFYEMVACLEFWDMACGCRNCGRAAWGEEDTHPFENFHTCGCPLRGRRDVHKAFGVNYDYLDTLTDHRDPKSVKTA